MKNLIGPPGRFILGHVKEFVADPLRFLTHCARTYGDVVPFRLAHHRCLLVSNPELIEQVFVTQAGDFRKHSGLKTIFAPILGNGLFTSEGDFWRRQRKLSAPAFHPSRLPSYSEVMLAATVRMLETWSGGDVRDVHADMTKLTFEIVCKTLFGADASLDAAVIGEAFDVALEAIGTRMEQMIPAPLWFPTRNNRRLQHATRTLDAIVLRIIAQGRSAKDEARSDLLSILLRQHDDDGSVMTDRQLLEEIRTLVTTGHETSSLTLTYALYLLATDRNVQTELQAELDAELGGRPPVYDDLPKLRLVRNTVYESLRLYPPGAFLGREAIADCTIGEIPVAKGTSIFASTWVLQRDARFFRQPDDFIPSRWTDEFEKSLPRFAYFPFGGGPRICIGQSFALTEVTLCLAAILQRYSLESIPGFHLELSPFKLTLRPRNGVRLLVTGRGHGA